MQRQLVAVGAGALGVGALFGWAFTADHFERKHKRQEEAFIAAFHRKDRQIAALEEKLGQVEFTPWQSINEEDVAAAAAAVDPKFLTEEGDEEGVSFLAPLEETETGVYTDPEAQALDEAEVLVHAETEEETESRLRRLIDQYTSDPSDVDTFVKQAKVMPGTDEKPPFVIPVEEYSHGEEGETYAKITLMYYHRHRILIDDEEDVIDPKEVNDYVGWRNLNQFGGVSGDPDTVFVRNHRLKTDFEVVKDDDDPPIHVRYGMGREEFAVNKAAGVIKFRDEDRD